MITLNKAPVLFPEAISNVVVKDILNVIYNKKINASNMAGFCHDMDMQSTRADGTYWSDAYEAHMKLFHMYRNAHTRALRNSFANKYSGFKLLSKKQTVHHYKSFDDFMSAL